MTTVADPAVSQEKTACLLLHEFRLQPTPQTSAPGFLGVPHVSHARQLQLSRLVATALAPGPATIHI